jgi:lipid II:glycine glycyltransferase (peptidoglycan interpeptide bridge formation enzyme)
MIKIESSDSPNSDWNKYLQTSELGTIYQTKEYASYIKSRLKSKPKFLRFYTNNDKLVGQLLLFQSFKGRGLITKSFGRGLLFSYMSKLQPILPKFNFWSYGPIIFNQNYATEISESFGNLLNSWKSPFKGILHPLDHSFDFPKKFNFEKKKTSTFIIDLKQDTDSIFKKTNKHSVQKNIKRSIERGVKITQIKSEKDLLIYYQLQKNYRQKNKIQSYEKADILEGFKYLSPLGYNGFIAWYDENPICAISFSYFNNYINESGIARSTIDSEQKLYSQDLLRWNIITWGKANNCRFYDMSGIKPENRNTKEEGIFRNKQKWGGTQIDYWIYSND